MNNQKPWNHRINLRLSVIVTALLTAGCGTISIDLPESNASLRSTSVTMRIQKDDRTCNYRNNTFRAVLNEGQSDEADITSAFSRLPNSNNWTAFRYTLAEGSYNLSARAEFENGACGRGRASSRSRNFEVRVLDGLVTYESSCGSGEFTFEPYPAILPTSDTPTPGFPTRSDTFCISPGSVLTINNLRSAYPDLVDVVSMDLAILHTRWDPQALGDGGIGVWFRTVDPTYLEITQFDFSIFTQVLVATIPFGITGHPPAAASIRIRYIDNNIATHEVDIEMDRRGTGGVAAHGLFFVPHYDVNFARSEVSIGFNLFDRTINDSVLPEFATIYPRGWEEYCRIRSKNLSTSGFPGTVTLMFPNAGTRRPIQGYEVQMPSSRTGEFDVNFQVVCPVGLAPAGSQLFSSWGVLGPYDDGLLRGMPNISNVLGP